MIEKLKSGTGPTAIVGAFLLCLPCLLPVLAVLVGVGAVSAFGGWIGDNGTAVALGVAGALVAAPLGAYAFWVRRRPGAVCDPADVQASIVIDQRPRPE